MSSLFTASKIGSEAAFMAVFVTKLNSRFSTHPLRVKTIPTTRTYLISTP